MPGTSIQGTLPRAPMSLVGAYDAEGNALVEAASGQDFVERVLGDPARIQGTRLFQTASGSATGEYNYLAVMSVRALATEVAWALYAAKTKTDGKDVAFAIAFLFQTTSKPKRTYAARCFFVRADGSYVADHLFTGGSDLEELRKAMTIKPKKR